MFKVGMKLTSIKTFYGSENEKILEEGSICTVYEVFHNGVLFICENHFFGFYFEEDSKRYVWDYFDKNEYTNKIRYNKINKIKDEILRQKCK